MGYSVDYDQLRDHGAQLGALRDEFRGIEDHTASYEWAIGHGGLADKLGTFASNWSEKRDQLAEGLDGVSQCATGAADGYCQVDGDIAGQINGTTA